MASPGQDPLIFGPFPEGKFLGATIVEFSINASWQEQSYYLNITLVEDFSNGDYCILQDGEPKVDGGQLIGTCMTFQYGNFRFDGLLKSFDQSKGEDGYPIYKVTLAPPNEILDAVQVVLASYIGPNSDILFGGSLQNQATFSVSNLINVYGWAEGGGEDFGRSSLTDIGMPWEGTYGIKAGLQYLTSIPDAGITTTNFGSYIRYKGNLYTLDLSNLPTAPNFYYVGGVVNMTLQELMSRFFEDAGCNYLIKLTLNENNPIGPHTISFIVVPRYVQQPLGKILQYINGQENINHSSHGQELRSDITQAFLVGGSVNYLQPIQNGGVNLSIIPFFGFDFNGNPIIGYKQDGTQFADDDFSFNLNATPVADIMGELGYGLSYPCNILELRCALGNYETWAQFIAIYKPQLAQQLRLYGAWQIQPGSTSYTLLQLMNVNPDYVNSLSTIFQENHWPAVAQRLYEFVRGQADVYYGKKFIVLLPFQIQIKIDPTTSVVTLSNDLADAGYAPEGEQLLGLNYINENFFLDQTSRFYPFVRFLFYSTFNSVAGQKILQPNIAYLKGTSAVVQYNTNPQNSYVYSRCEQGEDGPVIQNGFIGGGGQIFFVHNKLGLAVPAMVVTIPDAVWAQADDITGSLNDIASMVQVPVNNLLSLLDTPETAFNLQIHPPAYYPNGIAVALKSNQELYGPWGKYSVDGKLNFEQDDGLVPWEYGSYTTLTQAAISKLNTIATGNQVLERGDITEVGLPKASLGEQLVAEGPTLTSIQCQIGVNQVTTTYTMETFVNRVGAFLFENAERLRRIGKIYQQMRRSLRQLILTDAQRSNVMKTNYAGFMYGTSYAVEQHSPHNVLGGRLVQDDNGNYISLAWTQTPQESLAKLGLRNQNTFKSTACVSMEFLLRPYTTDTNSDYLSIMPGTDPNIDTSNLIISATGKYSLNPLQAGCDINWLVSNNTYKGMRISDNVVDFKTARSMALRGPIMICGWGFDLQGNPLPNSGMLVEVPDNSGQFIIDYQFPLASGNDKFMPNYLSRSDQWPAAPLDLMYDKFRSVWTSPGMVLHGINSGTNVPWAKPNYNYMQLYINGKSTDEFIAYKTWLGSANSGDKIIVNWNPLEKSWELTGVACSE